MSHRSSSKRSLSRTQSIGAPLASCFGGTTAIDFQASGLAHELDVAYGRLRVEGKEKEELDEEEEEAELEIKSGTIQLGKKPSSLPRMRTMRSLSFSKVLRMESKGSLASKVKGACGQVLDAAKKGSPHINELFVGNQLFLMQVTSSSLSRRATNLSPSAGLLHKSVRNADQRS